MKVLDYKEIRDKIKGKNLEMKYSVEKMASMAKIVEKTGAINIINDDPTDNKILECAIDGQADFIISKDKHLLKLERYRNIIIIKPEEFLKIIRR